MGGDGEVKSRLKRKKSSLFDPEETSLIAYKLYANISDIKIRINTRQEPKYVMIKSISFLRTEVPV